MSEFTGDEIQRLREAVEYAFRMEAELERNSRRPLDKRHHFEEAKAWNELLAHVMRLTWTEEAT